MPRRQGPQVRDLAGAVLPALVTALALCACGSGGQRGSGTDPRMVYSRSAVPSREGMAFSRPWV